MLALLAVLALTIASVSCSKGSNDRAQLPPAASAQATPIRVIHPTALTAAGDTRVTATVRGKSEATLSAKTTAQILKLDVRVGDRVKKGQVIARLDSTMASISLQNAKAAERLAQANLANAKLELERAKTLRDSGALAEATFDKLKMAFDIAAAQADQGRAAVRASGQQIADSTLTAPFDGVVAARFKNAGDTVSAMPPTPLVSLVDPDHLEVRMAIPEALAPLLHIGDQLPATASPSGAAFQVRISALGASVDAMSRTVEVLADVAEPVDPLLRPGTLATVDLSAAPSVQGLFLPSSAIVSDDGKSFVFVAAADRLQRRPVVLTSIKPGTVLVTQGIAAGDAVALDTSGLHDGDAVRVLAD